MHLLFNGLGAGNIGDEAMWAGFLCGWPLPEGSTVEVWDAHAPILKTFSTSYCYLDWRDRQGCLEAAKKADLILLVGDTPIMEWDEWPLRYHSERLQDLGQEAKLMAVGVGISRLEKEESRGLFRKQHLRICNWTVRSMRCRAALIDLGVPEEHIVVGADLAWLYSPSPEHRPWGKKWLQEHGIDLERPVVGINVVNERWPGMTSAKRAIAEALDHVVARAGAEVVFFCNETREGEYFDYEAARQVAGAMRLPGRVLPNLYFVPDQMAALLSSCTVAVSQRYHFTVLSILAGTPVLSFARGQKLASLLEDLAEPAVGTMEEVGAENLSHRILEALRSPDLLHNRQQRARGRLGLRACADFYFLEAGNPKTLRPPCLSLARASEIRSDRFRAFMDRLIGFARGLNLQEFTDRSNFWKYPWVWFNGLAGVKWEGRKVLDIGSELNPMPWFLAILGARVTLVENDSHWISVWEKVRQEMGLSVEWRRVNNEELPFQDESFDAVTSFSVIEHRRDRRLAVDEVARVLKPGGLFALSFDICEPSMGMSFPEWNGRALTMVEFEELVWNHPHFDNEGYKPRWNTEDTPEFIKWHLQSAPHHNYVVGASVLRKKGKC